MKKVRLIQLISCFVLLARPSCGQAPSTSSLLSMTPFSSSSGGSSSFAPIFSADGQFLVFASQANNLVTNDDNSRWSDIFVRNLVTGETTLVSVSTNGIGGGNGNSYEAGISSNAQFIVFQSTASNLVPGDNNGALDVFVRDMVNGVTRLVSANPGGILSGNARSLNPHITPDHRWVAFESQASNLVGGDVNNIQDVFVRDLQASTTFLVSVGAQGTGHKSSSASISDDGQRVAFESDAQFFSSNLTYSLGEIYVRDRTLNTTIWASSNLYAVTAAAHTTYRASSPILSGDGRFLALKTAPSLSATATGASLYFINLETLQSTLVSTNSTDGTFPEMTADGGWVAYESGTNVYVWNSATGTNLLVNVDITGTTPANGISTRPILSADGTKILFVSDASNLTTNQSNGKAQLYLRDLVAGSTQLISGRPGGSVGGDLAAIRADLSSDGNHIAFESDDDGLVPDDNNQSSDVFLRSITAQVTQLITARQATLPAMASAGWTTLGKESLSSDGTYAVFNSSDSQLIADDRNGEEDAFIRDLFRNTNRALVVVGGGKLERNIATINPIINASGAFAAYFRRAILETPSFDQLYVCDLVRETNGIISHNWTNGAPAAGISRRASLSRDGSSLAFESEAPDLAPGDANGVSDVFVWNSTNGSNILISLNQHGTGSGNAASSNPVMSRDGHWVVFESKSTDLLTNTVLAANTSLLYARDLWSNTTTLISIDAGGNYFGASNAVISADSKTVVFSGQLNVYAYDLAAATNKWVCGNCQNAAPSGDARWVAYEVLGTIGGRDIMLQDLQTGTTTLISTNGIGVNGGNAPSFRPQISYDGRYVAFLSRASDLVESVTNGWTQVLIWDRALNQTICGTASSKNKGSGNGPSFNLILGGDGQTLLFQSFSSDLVNGDYDNNQNIFSLRLPAADADADGMADDWEWTYFGTLARDGTGDFDGDGQSDVHEFLSGTNPTDPHSSLRVLTVDSFSGQRTILWSSVPGKSYQVQFRDDLITSNWNNLPGTITAESSTASQTDPEGSKVGNRFYRVLLIQ
jgi:hypothetical protein